MSRAAQSSPDQIPPPNSFQLLMRSWAGLGPYNAGHVMHIAAPVDSDRWRGALASALSDTPFEALPEAPKSAANPVIEHGGGDLDAAIRDQINRPFPPGGFPLRFFLVEPPDASHWFGVFFDHSIADSQSARILMRRCLTAFRDPSSTLPPLRLPQKSFASLFGLRSAAWNRIEGIMECMKHSIRHRRAFRIHLRNPADFASGFLRCDLPAVASLRAAAKTLGVTVNDLFLATIAQSIGEHTAVQRSTQKRRKEVALAVAVDIRPLAKEPLEDLFGCFLSYYTVSLAAPECVPLDALTPAIARHTRAMKSSSLRFFSSLGFVRWLWDHWPGPKERFLHKGLPLLAAISNVNLSGSWVANEQSAPDHPLLGYLRISPAGPLVPMVFTLTSIGENLSLCLTYRHAAFADEAAAAIAAEFGRRLASASA